MHILHNLYYEHEYDGLSVFKVFAFACEFVFVLVEPWLTTFICVVGTKGKHVPDAC